ncbi:MAG: Flp family type IVb pilin [Pseudomonadota bacterium]
MFKFFNKLRKDEKGATAIEYGLIAALVSIAAIGAMGAMGGELRNSFATTSAAISAGNSNSDDGANQQ